MVRRLIEKIKHIIIGTYNNLFHKEQLLSKERLGICKKCEKRKYIFLLGSICTECGCILKSKTTVKDENCPDGKW